jgi:uncharacterized protein YbjT (DUF2867 family)
MAFITLNTLHMSEKKTIAILGATGAQGGGLVRAILNDPASPFTVRAITRNSGSEKALALKEQGAEVVEADLDDITSLQKAFAGAHGVFAVTSYWEHMSPTKETKQAEHIAHAAKQAGVNHVIWSTLEDSRKWIPLSDNRMPTLNENYKVPHFDSKADADQTFTDLGVPTTFLRAAFYWENFIYFGQGPKRGEDGALALTLPLGDAKFPGISSEDIGKTAYGIFKEGSPHIGKYIAVAGEHLTGHELASKLGNAFGEPVRYNPIDFDTYRGFGFPGADDMGNMYQFNIEFADDFLAQRDVAKTKQLNPELQDLNTWLAVNKDRIPLDQG